ncbi:hypothetical protein HUJ04_011193 [Dendroctonus ponderosae]|nr:hypothetical protein HUJ04_011193 [Dendroctonus ponderosae]
MGVTCFVCNKIFSRQSNLNRHCREVHGLEASIVSYDKSVWNYKCLESNCNNSYQKNENLVQHLQRVHNLLFDEPEEIVFTSYSGKPSSQQRVRQLKSQASCKLDSACTSVLKLRHNEKKFYVHFQKTHYGHNLDLQHLRISKHDKGLIASKLIAGVTKTR